jgi:hypothetical protein
VSAAGMQSELVAASSDGLLSVFNMSRGIVLKEVIILGLISRFKLITGSTILSMANILYLHPQQGM